MVVCEVFVPLMCSWECAGQRKRTSLPGFNSCSGLTLSFIVVFFSCCFSGGEVVAYLFHVYWL